MAARFQVEHLYADGAAALAAKVLGHRFDAVVPAAEVAALADDEDLVDAAARHALGFQEWPDRMPVKALLSQRRWSANAIRYATTHLLARRPAGADVSAARRRRKAVERRERVPRPPEAEPRDPLDLKLQQILDFDPFAHRRPLPPPPGATWHPDYRPHINVFRRDTR